MIALRSAFISLVPLLLIAQPPVKERSKVGLALAGGSALGLAHVGVLQWFFEHLIPVDSLAGTSMGGVIGCLFCSGIDPEEMKEFLRSVDWDTALSGASFPPTQLPAQGRPARFPEHSGVRIEERISPSLSPAPLPAEVQRLAYRWHFPLH